MNLPRMLNRPKIHTKRIVDIEHSQTKTRLAQQLVLSSSYAEVRCIRCEIRDGVLYLRGQVTSFYLKQLTQEAVRWMKGIDAISNCVEVVYSDRPVTVADALMPERSNIQLPTVLMDVTECRYNSAGSQLTIGQR
ncbi:MAG: BON domain-containing protein [Planctomycetaceae bacterium]|nr:BON domain-containing protein [Planctomycetaceae bacterium]